MTHVYVYRMRKTNIVGYFKNLDMRDRFIEHYHNEHHD
jgi:hypothetical protein